MHLIIHFSNGQAIHVQDSWAAFAQKHLRQGLLYFDGAKPGRLTVVGLDCAEQFSDDEWAEVEKQAEAQKRAAIRANAQAQIDAWHKLPWLKRVGRKCPYTLPAEPKIETPAKPEEA